MRLIVNTEYTVVAENVRHIAMAGSYYKCKGLCESSPKSYWRGLAYVTGWMLALPYRSTLHHELGPNSIADPKSAFHHQSS